MKANPPCPTCKQPETLTPTTLCAEGERLWKNWLTAVGNAVVTGQSAEALALCVAQETAWERHLHGVAKADVLAALDEATADWDSYPLDEEV